MREIGKMMLDHVECKVFFDDPNNMVIVENYSALNATLTKVLTYKSSPMRKGPDSRTWILGINYEGDIILKLFEDLHGRIIPDLDIEEFAQLELENVLAIAINSGDIEI